MTGRLSGRTTCGRTCRTSRHRDGTATPRYGLVASPARRAAMARASGLALVLAGTVTLLPGCSRDDPQAALEAAVGQLQERLEARDADGVLDLLGDPFRAQDELDRDWARRTMTLLFLRYAHVKVVALARTSRIDPNAPHVGHTDAQVLLSGAQDLIPDRVAPYAVRLEWRHDGKRWKLHALTWQ
jgi:hypothetical protein